MDILGEFFKSPWTNPMRHLKINVFRETSEETHVRILKGIFEGISGGINSGFFK